MRGRRTRLCILGLVLGATACDPTSGSGGESRDGGSAAARDPSDGPVVEQVDEPEGQDPRVWFVAPDGDDTDPGSRSEPWATLEHGLAQLRAGQTLRVHGGIYDENIQLAVEPGRSDARVRVEAVSGEEPVLRGLLWLEGASYWTIDGLNVTWNDRNSSDDHMVKLIGGTGWVFSGAEVWDARSFAAILIAGSPDDWALRDNCVHDTHPSNETNQDQLVYVNSGLDAGPGVIERNLLFGAPNGMGIKLGGPSEDSGGAANVAVRYNTVVDAAQSIMVSWRSTDNELTRNLLGSTGDGYGVVRGYKVTGEGNVAADNAAFDTAHLLLNDDGYVGVEDGGSNSAYIDPDFDQRGECDGFRPENSQAAAYGHLAPEAAADR